MSHIIAGHHKKILHFILNKPRSILFGYPRHVLIEPTLECNIKCPLCPSPQNLNPRKKQYDSMSFSDFKKVVDNCRDILYRVYLTFSGEPLLNRQLGEMIEYLTQRGIVSMVSTNATLMTKSRAKEIIDAGLDYLIISFDGFSKRSFEAFRSGANFERTLANIENFSTMKKMLGSRKPYVDIQWIANRLNETEIKQAEQYFDELDGIDEFHVKSMSLNEHIYSEKEIEDYKKNFLPARRKIRVQYINKERSKETRGCSALLSPVILANGDMTICCIDFKGEYVVGNILDASLRELWRSKEYRCLREKANRFGLPICERCPIRFN